MEKREALLHVCTTISLEGLTKVGNYVSFRAVYVLMPEREREGKREMKRAYTLGCGWSGLNSDEPNKTAASEELFGVAHQREEDKKKIIIIII